MTSTVQLLGADRAQSVIASIAEKCLHHCYDPFGQTVNRWPANAGFNGAYQESITAHYILGNGYRAYSAVLRRFLSPDSISPFGRGGFNAYAYCKGDPVNAQDSTGHAPGLLAAMHKAEAKAQKAMLKNAPFFEMYSSTPLEIRLRLLSAYGDQSSGAIGKHLFETAEQMVKNNTDLVAKWAPTLNPLELNIGILEVLGTSQQFLLTIARKQKKGQPAIVTISNAVFKKTPGIKRKFFERAVLGAKLSADGHLRARELMLRQARRNFGPEVIEMDWYKKAVELNAKIRKDI